MYIVNGKYTKALVFASLCDHNVIEQVQKVVDIPQFKKAKVRVMPDCHVGKGCVIGFTSELRNGVVPNLVGVDIGCGVLVCELGWRSFDLSSLDNFICKHIPSGFAVRSQPNECKTGIDSLYCRNSLENIDRIRLSLGTLGGGNHFIEVDEDEQGYRYLVIHSGSRSLGTAVCGFYQKKAEEILLKEKSEKFDNPHAIAEKLLKEGRKEEIPAEMKKLKQELDDISKNSDLSLASLSGKDMDDYLHDMKITQQFASENRRIMAEDILSFLGFDPETTPMFQTIHNYIDFDDAILRKGAVRAHKGDRLIIPLNMRDGCLICRGKGNPDWNYSAPHGAGRVYSRKEANQKITLEEFKKSMEGIYSSSVTDSTIDESCFAYKPCSQIIEDIEPSVRIEKRIKSIYSFKAH